ncbi:MAG: glycosyltransferase family 4 protein [Mycobacteriales bacterium]
MRVALVHPYSWPQVRRGGERYLHDLGRWLAERGHEVDLLTGPGEEVETGGARLVRLPLRVPRRLEERHGVTALDTFGAAALPWLLGSRYDVVHSFVPSGGLAAAMALQPSVYTALGHPSPANPPARAWSRALLRRAVRAVRVPAALSRSAADGLEALTGRAPVVLPPGVRTADFAPRLEAPEGPVRLLFNGFASDPRKRLGLLLQALPAVLEELPDARLVLGGGGDPSPALDRLEPGARRVVEAVVDDLGAGSLADVPARYRAATVSVLPSVDEAFGLVLVESLACGTPVVCSRSGGMPEIVEGAPVGEVCEPGDPASLARAVVAAVALARTPGTSARCSDHARRWDWDVAGPLHERAYGLARG